MANVKLSQLPALASPTDTTSIPVVDGGVTKQITGLSLATYVNGKNTAYTLPTASTSTLGGVKVDGSSVTINNGIISVSTGLTGSVVFKGTWNANTNTPTLVNGTGTSGWMYIVGTAGTQNLGGGTVTYNASDLIVYDGTNWIDIAANNGVVSFNTRTGAVTLTSTDVTAALGFTPYDATNPNSYLTTITSSQVTGALGYTPIQTTSLSVTASPANVNSSLSYNSGVFTFTPYSLPSATTTSLGGVKIDNSTITINNDVISVSSALTNAVQFKGGWDASTNTPALGAGLPAGVAAGWEYIVSAAGTQNIGSGSIAYAVNDLVIYNGSSWIRIPGSTSVVSFNTRQGAITLTNTDVTTALGFTPIQSSSLSITSNAASGSTSTLSYTGGVFTFTSASASSILGGISVSSSNGFSGSNSSGAITIQTSITGLLKGNGTAISAAVAGTDYFAPASTTANYVLAAPNGSAGTPTFRALVNADLPSTITATAATATSTSTAASLGYLGLPQSATATTATLAIGDAGKHIYVTTTGQTITIPAASSVAYPIGTTITFIAGSSATTVSIAIASDTLRLAGSTNTGTRTLAANGMATAVKVAGTSSAGVWYINGTGLT